MQKKNKLNFSECVVIQIVKRLESKDYFELKDNQLENEIILHTLLFTSQSLKGKSKPTEKHHKRVKQSLLDNIKELRVQLKKNMYLDEEIILYNEIEKTIEQDNFYTAKQLSKKICANVKEELKELNIKTTRADEIAIFLNKALMFIVTKDKFSTINKLIKIYNSL